MRLLFTGGSHDGAIQFSNHAPRVWKFAVQNPGSSSAAEFLEIASLPPEERPRPTYRVEIYKRCASTRDVDGATTDVEYIYDRAEPS